MASTLRSRRPAPRISAKPRAKLDGAPAFGSLPLVLDLRSQASIERAMADVIAAFGHLDVLVNNAGANLRKLAVDVTLRPNGTR